MKEKKSHWKYTDDQSNTNNNKKKRTNWFKEPFGTQINTGEILHRTNLFRKSR
jgi:hypothetical protein